MEMESRTAVGRFEAADQPTTMWDWNPCKTRSRFSGVMTPTGSNFLIAVLKYPVHYAAKVRPVWCCLIVRIAMECSLTCCRLYTVDFAMLLVHLGFPTYCGAQTGTASRSLNSSFYLNSEEARSIHQTGIHRSSCDMLWRRWWQWIWEAMTLRRPRGKLRFRSPAMLLVWCLSHAMPCVGTRQDAFSMLLYGARSDQGCSWPPDPAPSRSLSHQQAE